jgi:hypothetical protein
MGPAKNAAKRERVKMRLLLSRENRARQHGGIGVRRRPGVRGRNENRGPRGERAIRARSGPGRSCSRRWEPGERVVDRRVDRRCAGSGPIRVRRWKCGCVPAGCPETCEPGMRFPQSRDSRRNARRPEKPNCCNSVGSCVTSSTPDASTSNTRRLASWGKSSRPMFTTMRDWR